MSKYLKLSVIMLASLFLIAPASAAGTTNVSLLYGWNGTNFVPLLTDASGQLLTSLNTTDSVGLTPNLNNTYDLGSTSLLWANLYVRSIRGGSGPLSLFAGGNEIITLLANGNVGIGTTSPNYKLDVQGVINVSGVLVNGTPLAFGNASGTGSANYLPYWTDASTLGFTDTQYTKPANNISLNVNNTLYVNNSGGGNVGIGTTSPLQQLTVIGTANITGGVIAPNVTFADGSIQTSASIGTNVSLLYGVNQSNTAQQLPVMIDNGALKLTVRQANINTANGLAAGATGSDLTLSGRLIAATANITGGLNVSAGGLNIILGNVGIGTASPAALLHLSGVNTANNLSLNVNNTLYVNNSNVGIGTTSPNYKLDVNGVINASGISINGSSAGKMILLKANSGSTTSTSAENVDTVAISGLTALDSLLVISTIEAVDQAVASPNLHSATDNVNITRLHYDGGNGNLPAGNVRGSSITITQAQSANTKIVAFGAEGAFGGSTLGNLGVDFTTSWTGSWTLALRHYGVTSGGTFRWSWRVYKIAGQ